MPGSEASPMNISIVILTYNSEDTIATTIESVTGLSDDIHAVDSFSSDKTLEILSRYSVNVVQHAFVNYGAQRNWAIDHLPLKHAWELHLDADESLSEELVTQIQALEASFPNEVDGYYVPRLVYFLGRPIRHGGMFPIWHLRLFRRGKGRCENRLYDQHFYVNGQTAKLFGVMIDDIRLNLAEWTSRHSRWAMAEACEISNEHIAGRIQADLFGDPVERKRFFRKLYNCLPLFMRPFLLFIYRYIFRLGFLDGREGLIFFVLQTFWFRFLVDAMTYEKRSGKTAR